MAVTNKIEFPLSLGFAPCCLIFRKFITRCKRNLDFTRREHRLVDKTTGLRSNQTIVLTGPKSSRLYSDPLRRVAFYDSEHKRRLVFLTNNFALPAQTVARLYKYRWQVEVYQPECPSSASLYQLAA